jgi:hypothetical protein
MKVLLQKPLLQKLNNSFFAPMGPERFLVTQK